jgi:hypothetical protein
MRVYAAKVELQGGNGAHLRYIPGQLAASMVSSGHAAIARQNGRVKAVKLLTTATTHLHRIGEPSDGWMTPPFTRRVRSDDHRLVWWEHHPRATYE